MEIKTGIIYMLCPCCEETTVPATMDDYEAKYDSLKHELRLQVALLFSCDCGAQWASLGAVLMMPE